MEPSETQFPDSPKIYRKGDSQAGLLTRSVEQSGQRAAEADRVGESAMAVLNKQRGITGADNVVVTKVTLDEANRNPDAFGGPVSGAEMDRLERRTARSKKERSDGMARARRNLKRY